MQGASEDIRFSFVSVWTTSAPTMFEINFQSIVVPEFTFCVYSNLSISSRAKQRHHTTLVVGVDSSPSNCSGFTSVVSLCAQRVFHLSEHAPTERKSSSSDTSYTSHFLLSCADS